MTPELQWSFAKSKVLSVQTEFDDAEGDTCMPASNSEYLDRAMLQPLAREFPTEDAAVAEIARRTAELVLPKGTIHVISDVHGEDKKLRHVINNASGTLRPLVERLFKGTLDPKQFQEFLTLIFYPAEVVERLEHTLTKPEELRAYAQRMLHDLFKVIRVLAGRYSLEHTIRIFPAEFRALLAEGLQDIDANDTTRHQYLSTLIDELAGRGRVLRLIHLTCRAVRNLAVDEIILAGDCWDRGPRGDRVVDYLMDQPNVAFVWGNHDAAWYGACLGQEALIAHVLRVSLRYRRLSQIEEGYGITVQPLEHLVRTVYADDPATCYTVKGSGLRETILMQRMQKAAAIIQFKLEGPMIERNPEWNLDHRRLLHKIDYKAGTIELDGKTYPLKDKHFPTIDPKDPYKLSPEEATCIERIKTSFMRSQKLWNHVKFLVSHGTMYLRRDNHLIFHGCVSANAQGEFQPMIVDGKPYTGRALFEAIERVIIRTLYKPTDKDRDLMWYLWSGPRSPLFGKDRITTLESYLIEDKATHEEKKDPYFSLIHEVPFCDKVLAEFGVDPKLGLIVNGHVPVKVEKGENPVKRSGKAITIDGAFSEAYGDHGFTLVLEPEQTFLARHYHFESVEAAIKDGIDIIPSTTTIKKWDKLRRTGDTERGEQIRSEIKMLERLVEAYRSNALRPR
jgi:fructose-1,6-bisphosphatase-3